ncbi:hydroxyacid dehydrogenase [Patescibacteria group bacterium]|nr:hydroxyacid dehydrogenase [Patescibacteria group bacterium]
MTKQTKIGFFGVKGWEREIIEKEIARLDAFGIGIFEKEVQDDLVLAGNYEIISIFINSFMDKKVLAKLPNLKMIATRSTGTDHIDIQECNRRGIRVANVPEYGSRTVAEYSMALLLAVAKKIVVAHETVEEGHFSPEGLTGVDLYGKTLGVVGVGKIGANMVKLGKGFGMKVLGVENRPDLAQAKRLGYESVSLSECLKRADFVSLHVPAIKETFHLINKTNIKTMKSGAILINTCRGPVVEVEALLWGLNHGVLSGLGLDVTEEESRAEDMSVVLENRTTKDDLKELVTFHMLRDRDDVVFTPHNAFNTKEAIGRIVATTVDEIKKMLK